MVRLHRSAARAGSTAALALALVMSASACSGDDEPDQDPPSPEAGTSQEAAGPLATTVRLGKVAGRLPRAQRTRLQSGVAEVVDTWIDTAYLGDFPRTDFADAFPAFTKGAVADARRDAALMSNEKIGSRVDEVVAVRRAVVVDALAVRRRAVAATARFVLRMELEGDLQRADRVGGRLFLTWRRGTWRVIGYDVQREVVR
jgi:hypothetical protein